MLRLKLIGALAVVIAFGAGWMVARNASVFAVRSVKIVGVQGDSAQLISNQLTTAARGMTTTHFSVAKLRAAVSRFAQVSHVYALTKFPHGVEIKVKERRTVAVLLIAGHRVAVASDGTLLPQSSGLASLPAITPALMPVHDHVVDSFTLSALALLGAAPRQMLADFAGVTSSAKGLTVHVRNGPLLFFGGTARLHAKWTAAVAVLADAGSQGASYVDVRLPERPVAQVQDPQTSGTATSIASNSPAAGNVVLSQTVTSPSSGG
jgi:cell division protein FtsQ